MECLSPQGTILVTWKVLYDLYVTLSLFTMFVRYRITAGLIFLILDIGYLSPHKTLNQYVHLFTNFQPNDGELWTDKEQEIPCERYFEAKIIKLNLDKLGSMRKLNGHAIMQANAVINREITCIGSQ